MVSTQEQLDNVQAAIQTALTSGGVAEYTVTTPGGTTTVKRYPLTELRAIERDLLGRLAAEKSGGGINYYRRGRA